MQRGLLITMAVVLAAALVSLSLLLLSIPAGWSTAFGHAPDVGAAWAGAWPLPLPRWSLTPGQLRVAGFVLLALAWSSYGGACWLVQRAAGHGPTVRVVAAGALLAQVALLLAPPTLSKDLYHYALFGRMLVTRGLNPYVNPGDALAGDPIWQLANWRELTTHYGPVFTWLSAAGAWLGGGGAIATALVFKALASLAALTAAWAIWRLARPAGPEPALRALMLFAWNPVVLLESAGSGHNDFIMIALALLGVLLIREPGPAWRPWLGFAVVLLSVHVKWVTAALAGLVALDLVHRAGSVRRRLATLGGLLALALVITGLLYLPFRSGRSGLWGSTLQLLFDSRQVLEQTGGAGGVATVSVSWWKLVMLLLFIAAVAAAIVVVWRRGQAALLDMSALVSAAFVATVFAFVFPWYLMPAFAFLAVGPRTRFNRFALMLLLTGLVTLTAGWALISPGIPR